jgi:hypothetical protein
MKIKFNKENIRDFFLIATASAVLIQGGYRIAKHSFENNKQEHYPQLKQIEIFDEKQDNKLVIDGITYIAPSGYTLEVVNGNVHAVRRFYLVNKPSEKVDENGKKMFFAPDGYIMVDGLVYREIIEYAEPIIKNSKSL